MNNVTAALKVHRLPINNATAALKVHRLPNNATAVKYLPAELKCLHILSLIDCRSRFMPVAEVA